MQGRQILECWCIWYVYVAMYKACRYMRYSGFCLDEQKLTLAAQGGSLLSSVSCRRLGKEEHVGARALLTSSQHPWIPTTKRGHCEIQRGRNETDVNKVTLSSAKDRFQIQRKLYERQTKLKPTETQTHEPELAPGILLWAFPLALPWKEDADQSVETEKFCIVHGYNIKLHQLQSTAFPNTTTSGERHQQHSPGKKQEGI